MSERVCVCVWDTSCIRRDEREREREMVGGDKPPLTSLPAPSHLLPGISCSHAPASPLDSCCNLSLSLSPAALLLLLLSRSSHSISSLRSFVVYSFSLSLLFFSFSAKLSGSSTALTLSLSLSTHTRILTLTHTHPALQDKRRSLLQMCPSYGLRVMHSFH